MERFDDNPYDVSIAPQDDLVCPPEPFPFPLIIIFPTHLPFS